MQCNTVSVTHVGAADEEEVGARAANGGRSVWLCRFVAPLGGLVLVLSSEDEARSAAHELHGCRLRSGRLATARLGRRWVPRDQVDSWALAPPRKVVQLVSPPPSPPETWAGWQEAEDGPKPPPELLVDARTEVALSDSGVRRRELAILATDLYEAVAATAARDENADAGDVRVPRVTIEAPPESITGLPEGFVLKEKKEQPPL